MISVTSLVENSVTERKLLAEHGLSFFVQTGSFRFLFDTGQSDLLLQNAKHLGIPIKNLDAVVLSHGHYDHTGGLGSALKLFAKCQGIHSPSSAGTEIYT